jgi:hypothetical protein
MFLIRTISEICAFLISRSRFENPVDRVEDCPLVHLRALKQTPHLLVLGAQLSPHVHQLAMRLLEGGRQETAR